MALRTAESGDIDLLVELMAGFYAGSGYALDRAHAAAAFRTLIADERLGRVWLISSNGQDVGHAVLTICYAMEYGGPIGRLDDLYIRPELRGRGIAGEALAKVKEFCVEAGLRAITVEVGHSNAAALTVYGRAGFEAATDRLVMALELAPPTHLA